MEHRTPRPIPAGIVVALSAMLALLFLPGTAAASERHPTLAELESEVMCPICHTTLDQSNSLAARRIEQYISRRIAAGDTKTEIKAKLVAQFGPGILAAPPRHGFDLLAWWLPIGGVLAGAVVLGGAAHRWSRTRQVPLAAANKDEPLDPELNRRLDEELARFE